MRAVPVWASEAIDLITESLPAAELVKAMATDAERWLRRVLERG